MSNNVPSRHSFSKVGVYSSNYAMLYAIEIVMKRRLRNCLDKSICLFATLLKISTLLSLITLEYLSNVGYNKFSHVNIDITYTSTYLIEDVHSQKKRF